jgi:hypothetical protein
VSHEVRLRQDPRQHALFEHGHTSVLVVEHDRRGCRRAVVRLDRLDVPRHDLGSPP